MVKVKVNDLMQKVYDKFKAAGVSNEQASIVTDLLIYADLRGIHSHGVLRVEHYIERIKAGGINLNSKFNIEEKRPSFALMDADGGFGHVATQYAMEWALETVEKQGIALIGIKNNSHAGALGYYNKMAIHQNKVSLMNELSKMRRVISKLCEDSVVETFLVLDATTGQNGVSQAKSFFDATGLTGIIITKMDGTSKGGIILSIKNELGIPVRFIGLGEKIDDLQLFDLEKYLYGLCVVNDKDE